MTDSETPMAAQELYDAWWERINGQESPGFDRMLRQLRSGILTMSFGPGGYSIRATEPRINDEPG